MKKAIVREVSSLNMGCDKVGNLLLVKFAFAGAQSRSVFLPAEVVFWLLAHLPVNQDPSLKPPPNMPKIDQRDWDAPDTQRVEWVNCTQFPDAIRMNLAFDLKSELVVLLNRANVELMRQIMSAYKNDLFDLNA